MVEKKREGRKNNQTVLYVLYALLLVFIAAYIATGNIALGALAFITLIITLVAELQSSVAEEGARRTIYEIITAIVAVVVLFAVLTVVLQARFPPISAVASCSMLPTLHRGDLVILHGIPNMTAFLVSHSIPIVNVSPSQMNATLANMDNEFLAFYAYDPSNESKISDLGNQQGVPIGLYNTRCLNIYSEQGQFGDYYRCFVGSAQGSNLIQYNYSIGSIAAGNSTESIILTQDISIDGHEVNEDYSNPIIVYQTTPSDSFTGDIVHRLVAAIRAGNQYYLLTKGDNNQGLDIQFSNYPITENNTIGYVIADIPYVGYLKLIMSGQLVTPAGCNTTILR